MPFLGDVGYKGRDTSAKAAKEISESVSTLRKKVLDVFKQHMGGLTADECAEILNISVLAIRPRVSELSSAGALVDTEERRKNSSGKSAIVWQINTEK